MAMLQSRLFIVRRMYEILHKEFPEVSQDVKTQFCKFLYMKVNGPLPEDQTSPPRILDEFWHKVLLHTKVYEQVCNVVGKFVHHFPRRELDREDLKEIRRHRAAICVLELFPHEEVVEENTAVSANAQLTRSVLTGAMPDQPAPVAPFVQVGTDFFAQVQSSITSANQLKVPVQAAQPAQPAQPVQPVQPAQPIQLKENDEADEGTSSLKRKRTTRSTQSNKKPATTINFFVKDQMGVGHSITMPPSQTILELKRLVALKVGMPVDQQRLIYAACQLQDDNTLLYYNIQNESTIWLMCRLSGC